MSVLIYDENKQKRYAMEELIRQLNLENSDDVDIFSFDDPEKALDYAGQDDVETAFISMDDKQGRGLFLAKRLKKLDSDMNLIPMAEKLKYGQELISLHVSGYILGDRTREKVLDELDNLRY